MARGSVQRIDADRCRSHGWQARIQRRRARDERGVLKYASKFFADGKHGGRKEACRRALAWIRAAVRKGW